MRENIKKTIWQYPEFFAAAFALFGLLGIGTITFHFLEKWSWISSFYFSVVTLATVGYGDLTPTTDFSRLITAIYILVGASIALASLGIIGSRYLEIREAKIKARRK
jgi:voltage-gated potassium channel